MKTLNSVKTALTVRTLTIAFTVVLGLGVVSFAGHVQATSLHDAAHDVRHATGFPCH